MVTDKFYKTIIQSINNFKDNIVNPNLVIVHIVSVILIYIYDVSFVLLYILTLSGDVEINPGPSPTRRRQCRILYANIRGLHANLNDLIAASRQHDISFCSETVVSQMRLDSEVLLLGFKKPMSFKHKASYRAQGMITYVWKDFTSPHKTNYEDRCHGVKV